MRLLEKINIKKLILIVLALCLFNILLAFFIGSMIIGRDVKKRCEIAQSKYQKDCVASLTLFLDDEKNDFRSRNSAIWALGQLGDKHALPALEKYYTGNIPNRESLDQMISQYELKKAIGLANGGLNITHFVWKR